MFRAQDPSHKVCVGHESAALESDGVVATWCVGLGIILEMAHLLFDFALAVFAFGDGGVHLA
jgi:hypothetical protein